MNPNTNQNTVVTVSREDRTMEYIPFGSDEKIKLSAKIIQDIVCIPTKSGKVCDEREAIKFMMLCKARALNPFEGDSFLMGYEGRDGNISWSLITAHQAFLKRAEPHPEFAGMRSGVVLAEYLECPACKGESKLKNGKPCRRCNEMGVSDEFEGDIVPKGATLHGGWATIYFKNRPEPMHKRVSLAVFRKPFGRWNDDPAGMIVKCAEADALRSSFPTKLGGLYLKEEVESTQPTVAPSSEGMFGRTPKPLQVDVDPAPTAVQETQPAPKPPKQPRKEKSADTSSAPVAQDEPSAAPVQERTAPAQSATPTAPPTAQTQNQSASPLENDKTRFSAWALDRGFTWEQMRPYVRQEYGNWVDQIRDFSDLSLQQAKTLFNARGDIENAIVGAPTN